MTAPVIVVSSSVSSPMYVPSQALSLIHICVNLGWGVVNVAQSLSVLCGGIKVKAGNDANVAALGEMWQGGGKGHQEMCIRDSS